MTDTKELLAAIRCYEQADYDGIFVRVSREACEKAAVALEQQAKEIEAINEDANAWHNKWLFAKDQLTAANARIVELKSVVENETDIHARAMALTKGQLNTAEARIAELEENVRVRTEQLAVVTLRMRQLEAGVPPTPLPTTWS